LVRVQGPVSRLSAMVPEPILCDVAANLRRRIETVGGRLKITSTRVVFEPNALNLQRQPAEISLTDIASVSKINVFGISPNGMLIRTKRGVEYKFVVWKRDSLINIISEAMRVTP
jgi:GRAM domain